MANLDTAAPSGTATGAPERWSKVAVDGLPRVYRGSKPLALVGGSDGFVLLTNTLVGMAFSVSADGATWAPASPGGFDPRTSVADVTGSDQGVFALGLQVGASQPVVWQFQGGRSWGPAVSFTGPAGQVFGGVQVDSASSDGELSWSIGSGSAGVLVAHIEEERSLTVWSSADGRDFRRSSLELPASTAGGALVEVVGTDDGFLVLTRGRLIAVNGQGDGAVLSVTGLSRGADLDLVSAHGSAVVLHGPVITKLQPGDPEYQPDDQTGANDVYAATTWCGVIDGKALPLIQADVSPGKLPDLGVIPRGSEIPEGLARDDNLFAMVGATDVGAMWTSQDGCSWVKAPVRQNGFDKVESLSARASAGGRSLLIGTKLQADRSLELTAWTLNANTVGASAAATPTMASSAQEAAESGGASAQDDPADAYREMSGEKSGNCPTGAPPASRCVFAVLRDGAAAVVTVYDGTGARLVVLMSRSTGRWQVSESYTPGSGPPPDWALDSVTND